MQNVMPEYDVVMPEYDVKKLDRLENIVLD